MKILFSAGIAVKSVMLISAQSGCNKPDGSKDMPACIQKEIDKIKSEDVWNPPASVWQYEYNGKTVYYIPAHFADIPSQLLDKDCNQICSPDGGFTGAGDGKCPDFMDKRTNPKLIWQDGRK